MATAEQDPKSRVPVSEGATSLSALASQDTALDDTPDVPRMGDEVLVSLVARAADGSTILDKLDGSTMAKPMEYKVGSNDLGPISYECETFLLQGMKVGDEAVITMGGQCTAQDGATLVLRLDAIYHTVDISFAKDGSVVKKRLIRGAGCHKPRSAAKVKLSVEAATDGFTTLAGFQPDVLEFGLGNGEVCEALELAVTKMTKGERAMLKVSAPHLAVEPRLGLTEIVAEKIQVTIELVDFQDAVVPCLMQMDDLVLFVSGRKEIGTSLFKAGRYQLAFCQYKDAVDLLSGLDGVADQKASDVLRGCELNMAACLLKIKDFAGVVTVCNSVLAREPENIKALYRRAQAELGLEDFAQCVSDCKTVVGLDVNNADARALLKQAREEQRKAKGLFG